MSNDSPSRQLLAVLWALPITLVGVVFVVLGLLTGGRVAVVSGVIEAHGGVVRRGLARLPVGRGGAGALTLGHVVLGANAAALRTSRAHERVHVAQYERLGIAFPFAYVASSLSALLHGQNPYHANRFEKEAASTSGRRPSPDER